MALLDSALALAQHGLRVQPAAKKFPVIKNWPTHASSDPARIRAMFDEHKGATQVSVLMGAGWFTFDVDAKKDGIATARALFDKYGGVPKTWVQHTPGGGLHYIFRAPEGVKVKNSRDELGPGIDIRGDGGQIIGPGSVAWDSATEQHDTSRHYRWDDDQCPGKVEAAYAPEWLVALVRSDRKKQAPEPRRIDTKDDAIRRARAYLARITGAISGNGGHDATFKAAIALVRGFCLDDEAAMALLVNDYNPRCEPPWSEKELRHKVDDAAKSANVPFGYLLDAQRPPPPRPRAVTAADGTPVDTSTDTTPPAVANLWRSQLSANARGEPHGSLSNAARVLANAPEWQGVFGYDQFQSCIVLRRPMPASTDYGDPDFGDLSGDRPIDDTDPKRVAVWLDREASVRVTPGVAYDAIDVTARAHPFHPVQDRLNGLAWDETPRLDSWLTRYLGVEATDYSSAVGRWWLISAVARAYQPGCKVDHVLVLEGPQHAGKSSAAKILSLGWFNDSEIDLSTKDGYIALRGCLVVELAELDGYGRHEAAKIKQFLSSATDKYRPPYARFDVKIPRQGVFIATVNLAQYLRDETGGRRFWPVEVTAIDLAALAADVDQLWAEAIVRYRAGEPWYPRTPLEHGWCESEQSQRRIPDPWEDRIAEWIRAQRKRTDYYGWLSSPEILLNALKIEEPRQDNITLGRVNRVMAALRWKQKRTPTNIDPARPMRWRDPQYEEQAQMALAG